MKFLKKEKGFTLIELLVVVSIIGVLASVVLSNLNDVRAQVKKTKVINQIELLRDALELYSIDNGHYPHRENGVTQYNLDNQTTYVWSGKNYNVGLEWDEFRAKMSPYIDMDKFENALDDEGRYYNLRYKPVKCGNYCPGCCPDCREGPNFKRYTLEFRKINTQEIIPEYYHNITGNWSRHCANNY